MVPPIHLRAVYPATYRDARGDTTTAVEHVIDGTTQSFAVTLRGIGFVGPDLDCLAPTVSVDDPRLSAFALGRFGELVACELDFIIPLPVPVGSDTVPGELAARLRLGRPLPNGGLDEETLRLALRVGDRVYESGGHTGWFEDELLLVQRLLPPDTHLLACINCGLSDYSPAGHGLFGGLACFRTNKVAYRAVRGKLDLFSIWPTMAGWVPETYWCEEFERRAPGTGYQSTILRRGARLVIRPNSSSSAAASATTYRRQSSSA